MAAKLVFGDPSSSVAVEPSPRGAARRADRPHRSFEERRAALRSDPLHEHLYDVPRFGTARNARGRLGLALVGHACTCGEEEEPPV